MNKIVPDGVWAEPEYAAADEAYQKWMRDVDCNDSMGAIAAAVDAALGAMPGVWVVYGDDHDYDYMSQWLVGVYWTQEEALAAAEADTKRYISEGGNKDRINHDIEFTRIGKRPDPLHWVKWDGGENPVGNNYCRVRFKGMPEILAKSPEILDWKHEGPEVVHVTGYALVKNDR